MKLSLAGKFWLVYAIFVIVCIIFSARWIFAAQATFSWLPNTEHDLAGYKIHYGSTSRQYTDVVDIGRPDTVDGRVHATIEIPDGTTFFTATAYDSGGMESDYSDEVVFDPPPGPPAWLTAVTVNVTVEVRQ